MRAIGHIVRMDYRNINSRDTNFFKIIYIQYTSFLGIYNRVADIFSTDFSELRILHKKNEQ